MRCSQLFLITILIHKAFGASIDDEICEKLLKYFDEALSNRVEWSVICELKNTNFQLRHFNFLYSVFDTWAKFQSGALSGNVQNPGHFSECVNFRHYPDDKNIPNIQGQHCMITFSGKQNASTLSANGFDWREL